MAEFRIAAAQVPSLSGEIERNIETHVAAVKTAAAMGVSVLVFPELSLTGYEPELAATQALAVEDTRLSPFSELAQRHRMHLVVGAPLANGDGKPGLGAILFGPDGTRQTYAKMHFGGTEPSYFAPGDKPLMFVSHGQKVGLSICADSSAPSHPETYASLGATVYAAGVFLNAEWYASDAPRLAGYASCHRLLVVMANHATSVGTFTSVGRSAAWSPDRELLAQASGDEDALVIATCERGSWRAEVCGL